MTVLVLCIDRDNDLGVKANAQSPIVGRAANVEAATRLALADPEDSDANSVFGAVHILDALRAEGVDADIVTLCGHPRVGTRSDRIIAADLDRVLAERRFDSCVFVTDGAEDEFLLPLVTGRIRVESVRRIIVKQHADMESVYYVIKKALEDDKLQRSLLLPFGLACLVFGIFAVLGQLVMGLGAIFITVGLYFLLKVLHVGANLRRAWEYVYTSVTTGRLSFFTAIAAVLIGAVGLVATGRPLLTIPEAQERALLALAFVGAFAWWGVAAVLVGVAGKIGDAYLREGVILWKYWMLPFSLVSIGLLLTAGTHLLADLARDGAFSPGLTDTLAIVLGLLVLALGYVSASYLKSRMSRARAESPGHVASAPVAVEEHGVHP